jgi:hypothetical protein
MVPYQEKTDGIDMEADAVPEKVTISHRGSRYEIGRGKRYYGIWVAGAPESDPVDRWPETPDGWAQAWTRFVSLEDPATITTVERSGFAFPRPRFPRPGGAAGAKTALTGAGLLGLGVVLGIAGLFPDYFSGQSLASQSDQLVLHLLFLAGWAASAALIGAGALRGQASGAASRVRAGALLGTGLSAVTLGMFLSDLGQVTSGGAGLGAGLVLSILGWAVCAAGSVAALAVRAPEGSPGGMGRPVRPRAHHAGPIALLVLGAIGTVAAFAPSWDAYTLTSAAGTQNITAGNAFSNPAMVITGDVLVMVAVVAVALAAAIWRPTRQGAALLAGAIIPMAAQGISALIQVSKPVSPQTFGISPAQASAANLSITSGVTPVFWVYCVFVIALVISCAWLFTEPALPATPNPVPAPWAGPGTPGGEDKPVSDGGGEGPEGGEPEDSENSYA